ncbi:hypothetical protein L3V83_14590 [Thiotrichales bacterium 19X7-9]|nr:hypothetical protein [Thiotrichales bacterium 19X7-9]
MPRNTGWVQDNFRDSCQIMSELGISPPEIAVIEQVLTQSIDLIKYSNTTQNVDANDQTETKALRDKLDTVMLKLDESDDGKPISAVKLKLIEQCQAGNCGEIALYAAHELQKHGIQTTTLNLFDKTNSQTLEDINHVVLSFKSKNGKEYIFDPQNGHIIENNLENIQEKLKLWNANDGMLINFDSEQHSIHQIGQTPNVSLDRGIQTKLEGMNALFNTRIPTEAMEYLLLTAEEKIKDAEAPVITRDSGAEITMSLPPKVFQSTAEEGNVNQEPQPFNPWD